ncbi:glycosyltransferase family 2 protein [Mucilaginibacter auburnensis]|uniref:Glycosyltransferase involved in cell wall biosynthesis n=1 Tax=Mucilaginibacter auburnensis TaxID=1457233 RepID=A0A2H9VM95_9SPHI|nr:glycosyltransferase family 2 protein [Mucilaginibacter auburnensis]PJJ79444.1 glycosyltransferase involved in cell wall biosynthesis [Mucilaginibacter auburnensis]
MQALKISLITVTRNAESTIQRCIESVLFQDYANVEYIIIDGNSTDGTAQIIRKHINDIARFVSEPDKGIYDAMNKGIKIATGDVVGILNADDFFASPQVLSNVAQAFAKNEIDALYGDLNYLKPDGGVVRRWVSGAYKAWRFNWGWMPPHPTFYCKRLFFNKLGLYDLDFGTAADYELMLRFMFKNKLQVHYLNSLMVNMQTGGASNQTLLNRIKAWKSDLSAMGKNGVLIPQVCVIFKPLRKLIQYL